MSHAFLLRTAALLAAATIGSLALRADVKLPAVFSDHMVLQRARPITVWGWADNGEKVTVRLHDSEVSTEAKDGRWRVSLPQEKAGGPYQLSIRGNNEVTLNDVLVGDVWICSGQSNMEWPLKRSFEADQDIANSANAKIRLITVPKHKDDQPQENFQGKWVECGPETVPDFTAVGYYFGRHLQKELGVPIGLIHTSWGGSPAEVWVREGVLEENPVYKAEILESFAAQRERYERALADWEKAKTETEAKGEKFTRNRPNLGWKPSELYNGMIAPLIPFGIRGAIWYQGESNAGRASQYRNLFPDMIANWRMDFGQGDFPFLFVQLAPWDKSRKRDLEEITRTPGESDWAELREAQLLTTKVLPKTGMAVITDVGDKDDIHPTKKEPVGKRLALAALHIAYGKKLVWSGPEYSSVKIENNKATVHFDYVGDGLEAKGGKLTGFAIAGHDRKFVWADAEIKGKTVVVSSPQVPEPIAVRYGWSDYPVINLFNTDGLPATPFRTDNFPMTTGPKLVTGK